MITPFKQDGTIDWGGLESLIDWYLAHGAEALFAVCQSSEMQFLSLAERTELARFTVKTVAGRVPVIASGHISDSDSDQSDEVSAMSDTGIDCLVLVTNRLDQNNEGMSVFSHALDRITAHSPRDLPLGLYECPAPFRRLLSDDEIRVIADDPRFIILKDVSCDLATVKRRISLTRSSRLVINNANAAIAHASLKAGAGGFCGVFTNFHPDLYRWLQDEGDSHPTLAQELAVFLALSASTESMGYPKLAKLYHNRLGTFGSAHSRAVPDDIRITYWALDAIIEKIIEGTSHYRAAIASLQDRK